MQGWGLPEKGLSFPLTDTSLTNILKYHCLKGKYTWATGQGLAVRKDTCDVV